jgi:hypothetical protein
MNYYSKELDGMLLIVTEDRRTYELRRSSNSDYISITPDEGDPDPSQVERSEFMGLWKTSGCRHR